MTSVFRFAPSPNGFLHLGHAYSALLNNEMAQKNNGRFLLRLEDIDITRCTPVFEQAIFDDLIWLGLSWEQPVRRQSEHFDDYQMAFERLREEGLVYPAFLSRGAVKSIICHHVEQGQVWPNDPDGAPLYPVDERDMPYAEAEARIKAGEPFAWRLHMDKALKQYGHSLSWHESGQGPMGETGQIAAQPQLWGDVIIARKETPTSYHLSVVVDDALQGITHVVRGRDLFYATAVHRLLQEILGLTPPLYHHHDLILDNGEKLSKSRGDTALSSLRAAKITADDVRHMVGF